MSQMHGWPKTEESARKVFDALHTTQIRLLTPEAVAKLNADIAASVKKFNTDFRRFNLRVLRMNEKRLEQHLRDVDDELDWLGEWGGRRR